MALAFLFSTNQVQYERDDGVIEFYEACSEVRRSFDDAAEWTGLSTEALLYQNGSYEDDEQRIRAISVALAAAQFGVHDVLAAKGLRPHMVGGLSLGGLVSAGLAGCLGRRELMEFLMRGDHRAEDGAHRAEAVAAAFLAPDFDPEHYYGEKREGVFLSGDYGWDAEGRFRIILLSGYRDALEALAAEEPPGVINVTEGAELAVHSPLRQRAREAARAAAAGCTFADPTLDFCSCLDDSMLTTADDVREMFVENVVKPISLVQLTGQMERNGARLGLVVGPSGAMDKLRYPFPVVFVNSPAAVSEAVGAVFEHGVRLRRD